MAQYDEFGNPLDVEIGNPVINSLTGQRRSVMDKLLGIGGDRYQLWPERMVRSAVTLPGQVMSGDYNINPEIAGQISDVDMAKALIADQQIFERTQDTAGLAMSGGLPFQVKGAVGSGPTRLTQPATHDAAPVFYSALEHGVKGFGQDVAQPDQWLGAIRNVPGIKQEEIAWSGLDDFLASKTGPVKRAEIEDYLAQNKVDLREVVKGSDGKFEIPEGFNVRQIEQRDIDDFGLPDDHSGRWGLFDDADEFIGVTGGQNREQATAGAVELARDSGIDLGFKGDDTKFSQYQLPGGENYREMLLTMPNKIAEPLEYGDWLKATGRPNAGNSVDLRNEHGRYARDIYEKRGYDYKSSHWDEPNVLAHIRFNDRMVDGKKTLFIEEIQSDWHQAGRKKGYNPSGVEKKKAEIDSFLDELSAKYNKGRGEISSMYLDNKLQPDDLARYDKLQEELGAFKPIPGGVPDAPFKKSWHELALKRMLRHAAENGYDQIAWTPGEVQAARYDLSQKISRVLWSPEDNMLLAQDLDGRTVLKRNAKSDELPDIVGKEVAEKLVNQVPKSVDDMAKELGVKLDENKIINRDGSVSKYDTALDAKRVVTREYNIEKNNNDYDNNFHNISGLDLKVGGEGMKGFYDKILPDAANKLGKKFGAKVTQAGMQTEPITPEMAWKRSIAGANTEGGLRKEYTVSQADKFEKLFKEKYPDYRLTREDAGSSIYFTVGKPNYYKNGKLKNYDYTGIKTRFSDHGAYHGQSLSVDPVSGNSLDDAFKAIDYHLNPVGEPPVIGYSIIDPGKKSDQFTGRLPYGSKPWHDSPGMSLWNDPGVGGQAVHTLPITPQMRDTAVGKGFPLFMGGIPWVPIDYDPFQWQPIENDPFEGR